MRHRNRHEGIRSVEIDRGEPDRATLRGLESGVAGVIDFACYDHLTSREAQLLFARAVELNDPVNRRHLLKQQRVVRPSLLEGCGACPCRPADLAFDLRHGLLDSARRRLGLFRLPLCQQFRCLPVGEPGLEAPVHGKHEHNHFDKGGNVFAEEALGTEPIFARGLLLHSEFS